MMDLLRRMFTIAMLPIAALPPMALPAQNADVGSFQVVDTAKTPIKTPSFAKRETAKLRLANGLEAYLVSDPSADKSAAGLCIEVGSWEDPTDVPGMAHFVEHLLFLGTEEYPDESEFDRFVGDHGGETNAHTGDLETCYFFAIDSGAFSEGLRRFSSFFRKPLFNPSGVAREITAIDQEYALRRQVDSARQWLMLKELANPGNPFHQFSYGNRATLVNIPQTRVLEWYQKHYSANLMHLVIYSSLSIQELQKLTIELFSPVPNLDRTAYRTDIPMTDHQLQGTMSWLVPIQQARSLTLFWELPPQFADAGMTRPEDIVGYVLGHEGNRSLLAQFKREGLAEAIESGGHKMGGDHFIFMTKITLTKAGLADLDTVIERFFQAIETLRKKGIPQTLFDDIQQMQRIRYQYQMRDKAYEMVERYTPLMLDEPLSGFPEQSQIVTKYDPKAYQEFIESLTPNRAHFSVLAPPNEIEGTLDRKEHWSEATYRVAPVSADKLVKWSRLSTHPDIDLPASNSFIPRHLGLVGAAEPTDLDSATMPIPVVLADDAFGKVYFAQDREYGVPSISWSLQLVSPEVDSGDPIQTVLTDLFVKSAIEGLSDISYDARMAGLELQITRENHGISLTLNGYSENATMLLRQVLERLRALRPDQTAFRIYKEALRMKYGNFSQESAFMQALEVVKQLLYKQYVTESDKAKAIRSVDHRLFLDFIGRLLQKNYSKLMLYGNMTKADGTSVWQMTRQVIGGEPYPIDQQQRLQVVQLANGAHPIEVEVKSKATGNAVILVIQDGAFSFRDYAIQQLLAQAMRAPFFSTLRTQQQTAYSLTNWDQEIERHLFSFFGAASNSHAVGDLLARFELMIETFLRRLGEEELPEDAFQVLRDALVAQWLRLPESMEEMGRLLTALAFDHDGDFKWKIQRAQALRALPYHEFVKAAHAILGKANKKRLAVLLRGTFPQEPLLEYKRAKNPKDLRKTMEYTPR